MHSASLTPADRTHVLIADSSHMQAQLLAAALRRRPEFKVFTCELDADAILSTLHASDIHVALMPIDHHIGARDMALLRDVHLAHPELPKVLLLESYDRELVVNAFRAGARGLFCFNRTPFRALCKCIQRVRDGEIWINREQMEFLIEVVTQVPSLRVVNARGDTLLTAREEQVVSLVAEGLSNREVANELRLSEHTVKKYLFRIFDKLGISSRVELVLYAVNHGEARSAEWVPAPSA